MDKAWTNIPGIHDNGPRDPGVWRLTLTAYSRPVKGSRSHLQISLNVTKLCKDEKNTIMMMYMDGLLSL